MGDTQDKAAAQLVMKREDGQSILSTAGSGDVTAERAAIIRSRLQELGFTVETGNLNTLSITGTDKQFEESFGISPLSALNEGRAAHATRQPDSLKDLVADVFVTPSPDYFP